MAKKSKDVNQVDAQASENQTSAAEEGKRKLSAAIIIPEIIPYIIIIVVAIAINTFLVINARIPSGSMETTIMTGERVFGNRLAYKYGDPQRYDIIIFHFPDDEKRLFVKRLIGLPGDTIELKDGQVYINGVNDMENEPFVSSDKHDNFGPYTVPENCYFMLGDNRAHSNDSRFWYNKCVRRDQIVGRAGFRYWPLTKIGLINKYASNW